jgi:hypothetical protein
VSSTAAYLERSRCLCGSQISRVGALSLWTLRGGLSKRRAPPAAKPANIPAVWAPAGSEAADNQTIILRRILMRLAMLRLDNKDQFGTIDGPNGRERSGASFGASREVWSSNGPLVESLAGTAIFAQHLPARGLHGPKPGHRQVRSRSAPASPLRQLQQHSSPNPPQKLAFKRTLLVSHRVGCSFRADNRQGLNENKD